MQWMKTWGLTAILAVFGLTVNETLLRAAQHKPSVVSNANLFCLSYSQMDHLNREDVVLLGASRMHTGFDLEVFQQRYPNREILQLAQSGRGTPYPVFKDIVENTQFNGTAIISVNEPTLISQNQDQLGFVSHCNQKFSLNDRANRQIATWLQRHFVFLNSSSSSLRLWGNLIVEQELPEPLYTETRPNRAQLSDFERAKATALKRLHDSRLKGIKNSLKQSFPTPEVWLDQGSHWQPLIQKFQERGGTIIFVRMPVSQERWELEEQKYPPDEYWKKFANEYSQMERVQFIHFANYSSLQNYNLPDTSHLDMRDRAEFTNALLDIIEPQLTVN
ncbi:UNVERIFIED_CONTAM: hypothetical protein BEN50_04290 [Euhalothece sp. KZN 001]